MITKLDIFKVLDEIKAPKGSVVTVHTSLKSIGEIEGGGQTLLDALIEYFTECGGLLVIPTHTWTNLDTPGAITLDLTKNETCLGVLPTLALLDGRGVRSMHPTHSVTVFGEGAAEFASLDDNTNTFASPDGCYGELLRRGGHILLIGVGNDKNTFIHCVEEILGVKNRNSSDTITTTTRLTGGNTVTRSFFPMYTEGCDDISLYFPKYDAPLKSVTAFGRLGGAELRLISTRKIYDIMNTIFERSGGCEILLTDKPIDESFYD